MMNRDYLYKAALKNIHYTNNINGRIPHIQINDAKNIMWELFSDILARVEERKAQYLPAYDDVAEWLTDNRRQGLLIMGSTGLGKTLLCSRVIPTILRAVDMGSNGNFTLPPLITYKATELEKVYEEKDKNAPLNQSYTIIEDIGTEQMCSNYGNKFYMLPRIIDEAETRNRLLILTTNLNDTEIIARYSPRTWSRLNRLCRMIVFDQAIDFRTETPIYQKPLDNLADYEAPPQI